MSQWLEINPKEFSRAEQIQIRGTKVDVFLSPYDMPEAVRGTYNSDTKKFLIEFKYIGGDEPLDTDPLENATIALGRSSKRIYKIELDNVELSDGNQVGLRLITKVDAVLNNLRHDRGDDKYVGNYQIAKQILEKRAAKLIQSQVAA